jgi:hypothetical protein
MILIKETTGMNDINTGNALTDLAAPITAEHKVADQPKTKETYAHEISLAWRKAVDSIFETGRILLEAKEGPYRLNHGAFQAMVRTRLPFSERTAQMLMRIARHPILSNANHGSLLPPSWRTLYALTKVPDDKLIEHIRDGTINPKLERKDVAALHGESPKPTTSATPNLREENARLKAELQRLHDHHDDVFNPNDTPANIARVMVEQMRRLSNDKKEKVLQEIKKQFKLRRDGEHDF